jgi:hypothetical protein
MRRAVPTGSLAERDARVVKQLEMYAGRQVARLRQGTGDGKGTPAGGAADPDPLPVELAVAREVIGRLFDVETPLKGQQGESAEVYLRRKLPSMAADMATVVMGRINRKATALGLTSRILEVEWRKKPALPVSDDLGADLGAATSAKGVGRQAASSEDLCGCMAFEHALVGNCLCCGRVICEREVITKTGSRGGRSSMQKCPFCLVPLGEDGSGAAGKKGTEERMQAAVAHKNKLLAFSRESARRTRVFDDQADYFDGHEDKWKSKEERAAALQESERLREIREQQRRQQTLTLSFTGDGGAQARAGDQKSVAKDIGVVDADDNYVPPTPYDLAERSARPKGVERVEYQPSEEATQIRPSGATRPNSDNNNRVQHALYPTAD